MAQIKQKNQQEENTPGTFLGVDFGKKKGVVGVNIADAGELGLIEKSKFDGASGGVKLLV